MAEMLHNTSPGNFSQQSDCRNNRIQAFAFVLAAVLSVLLCCAFAVSLSFSARHKSTAQLNDKLNPNYAPAGSLVRLPGIGAGRAQAIIAYRQYQLDRGQSPFRTLDDLQNVKGIGVKTAKNISKWIDFETDKRK